MSRLLSRLTLAALLVLTASSGGAPAFASDGVPEVAPSVWKSAVRATLGGAIEAWMDAYLDHDDGVVDGMRYSFILGGVPYQGHSVCRPHLCTTALIMLYAENGSKAYAMQMDETRVVRTYGDPGSAELSALRDIFARKGAPPIYEPVYRDGALHFPEPPPR